MSKWLVCLGIFWFSARALAAGFYPNLSPGMRLNVEPSIWDDSALRERTPVAVYIANDFSPAQSGAVAQSQKHLLRSLREVSDLSPDEQAFLTHLADVLENDWDASLQTIEAETRTFIVNLCKSNPQFNAGLAVFRNTAPKALVDGYDATMFWDHCGPLPEAPVMAREVWALPVGVSRLFAEHPAYAEQPLAHPYVLEAAFKELFRVYPSDKHRFMLIFKSHGDDDTALALRHPVLTQNISPKNLRDAMLVERQKLAAADLVSVPTTRGTAARVHEILWRLTGAAKPDWGMSKTTLLQILAKLGWNPKESGYLPIVFLDANDGALERSSDANLLQVVKPGNYEQLYMKNVSRWYHLDGDASERPVPYQRLFDLFGLPLPFARDLQDRLGQLLEFLRTNN